MRGQKYFQLVHQTARSLAAEFCLTAPDGWVVKVSEPGRTLSQNALMWPLLEAFAEQLPWPVNGEMCYLSADDWKNILTAAFRREVVRMTPGLDGGMVLLGMRTREFSKREFSDWIEFLYATAAWRGVSLERKAAA